MFANDSLYVKWMGQVQDGTMRRYSIEDDLLYFKGGRIVVPNQGGLRKDLMKEAHDSSWAGSRCSKDVSLTVSCVFLAENGRRYRGVRQDLSCFSSGQD